ncbi:MAG: S9 family peptidase [Phycisphaerales bacterium]|nr:S9 family peptidase [Phycisphaerales bacterium]
MNMMLSTVAGIALAASTSGLALAEQEGAPKYDARTFFETTSFGGGSFNHNATKLLIHSDETGVFNCYEVDLKTGERTAVTHSQDTPNMAVTYFPKDDRFIYTADGGGDELNHLYVREMDGSVKDITPGQNLKAAFFGWGQDDNTFWVMSNERNPQSFDIYQYDATTYERTLVFENEGGYSPADISRDGRWLALGKVRNNADDDIYLFDTTNAKAGPALVTRHSGNVSHQVETFDPTSTVLYYSSNEGSEFQRTWTYDLKSGKKDIAIEAPWDVMYVGFSWDGRYRVQGINADARTEVTIWSTSTNSKVDLPALPAGDIVGVRFSRDGSKMAFYHNGDRAPSNLYVMDMATKKYRRLTDALNPSIDPKYLVDADVIRFKSFDGMEIPCTLYKPVGASPTNPAPALVWVHGGPGGQTRLGYSANIQFLVNHGYAVLGINNRGSSGYGKTFNHADDLRHGEDDLMDCVYGRKYLESLGWVDKNAIGIMGGSYGGFMVAAALTFQPEVFDCGVDIFGVTNWVRTLEEIPPWWEDFREALYAELGDPNDPEQLERLNRISPLFHAENIVRPLMVIQGKNDPRVKQVESDELVAAAKQNGTPVEYVVFPDEGHGFRSKENRITFAEQSLKFLDRYLKKAN